MGLKAQSIEIIMDELIDQDPHENKLTLDPFVQVAKGINLQKGFDPRGSSISYVLTEQN